MHRAGYAKLPEQVLNVRSKMLEAQTALQSDPTNMELTKQMNDWKMEYTRLAAAELKLLKQKAKVTWLHDMDQNTRYFHSVVKEKSVHHSIANLGKSDGNFTETEEQIAQEITEFYEGLVGCSNDQLNPIDLTVVENRPVLTETQRLELTQPVTAEEIKHALFSISDKKAPGPDGYGFGFFITAWDIIQHDVILVVSDFFNTGRLLKQVNVTRVTLIPKKECPMVVGDYMPIACCDTVYKIISEVLTNRLSRVLDSIISSHQSAFLSGRSIIDNMMLSQDLVRDYHRKGGGACCLMKLDIQKAYDSLDWNFLKQVMHGLNFPEQFISWIFTCLSTMRDRKSVV